MSKHQLETQNQELRQLNNEILKRLENVINEHWNSDEKLLLVQLKNIKEQSARKTMKI